MPISNSVDHLLEVNAQPANAAVNILDESVRSGATKSYKILCTVDASFIALALFDPKQSKFFGLETFPFSKPFSAEQLSEKINSLPEQSSLLKSASHNKVSVQLSNHQYTFIPSTLFKAEDSEKYFFFNHPKKPNHRVETEPIKAYDILNVFSVDEQVLASLKKVFTDFSIHHHTTSLLQSVKLQSGKDNRVMYMHFRSGWIDLIVTEGKKLVLCNSFNYKSTEDAVYYILLVCEQLGLNPPSLDLVIIGEIEKESAIMLLLQKYIANIQYGERLKTAQFSYGFDKLPSHFYHSVFSHALCE
jgi:hypothetical protein